MTAFNKLRPQVFLIIIILLAYSLAAPIQAATRNSKPEVKGVNTQTIPPRMRAVSFQSQTNSKTIPVTLPLFENLRKQANTILKRINVAHKQLIAWFQKKLALKRKVIAQRKVNRKKLSMKKRLSTKNPYAFTTKRFQPLKAKKST